MNTRMQISIAVLLVGVLAIGFIGCKEKSEPAPTTEQTGSQTPAVSATATEQTTCPVMDGNPINKSIFTEYQGKKVYFCCPGCIEKFKAEPEKYVKELPQFKN